MIGLASSGLHSNGYSLARKIAFDRAGLTPESFVAELGRTVADEFLEPTRIYVRAVKTVYRHYRVKRIVHGIAHITGGGLIDNPPRILPEGCAIRLRRGSWEVPPVFPWLQALGDVPDAEMFRVFNMGIGLVLIVADYYAEAIARYIRTEVDDPRLGHRRGRRGRPGRDVGGGTLIHRPADAIRIPPPLVGAEHDPQVQGASDGISNPYGLRLGGL